jgi:hypothetical protein
MKGLWCRLRRHKLRYYTSPICDDVRTYCLTCAVYR